MTLSLSFSSSKLQKHTLNSLHDQSLFITDDDQNQPRTITELITPLANEWTPHKISNNEVMNSNMSNGLNFCAKKGSRSNVERFKSDSWMERLMLKRLKWDLDRLPEHGGMDEVEDMPVENFAKALLKGYGWYEGRGVGKNVKEDVKVFEMEKRNGREGLGFVNDLMVPLNKDSKKRAVNGERKERNERKEGISKDSTDHKRYEDYDKRMSSKRGRERERYETSGSSWNSKSWLNSNIRVRIISKELKGGRLYLKKGEIVEVVGPTTCDIVIDNSRELIHALTRSFLRL